MSGTLLSLALRWFLGLGGNPGWGASEPLFDRLTREKAERERLGALEAAAHALGLRFEAEPPPERFDAWRGLPLFGQGEEPRFYNLVAGAYSGMPVTVFDHSRVTRSIDSNGRPRLEYHHAQAFGARLDRDLPELQVQSSALAAAPTEAPDARDSARVFGPNALVILSQRPGWHLECGGRAFLLYTQGRFRPDDLPGLLNFAAELLGTVNARAL